MTLTACELEEIAIPSGEEVFVVHAIMRPDQQRQFVLLERSWGGEFDPADLDHFDLPPNSPQLPVSGATVSVSNLTLPSDPCGASVIFGESASDGLYQSPGNCPTMRPGDVLELRIDTPTGETIRGVTEVVGMDSAWVATQTAAARFGSTDTLRLNRDADTLLLSVEGGPGRLVELQVNRIDYYGDLSTSEFDHSTILADSNRVTVPGSLVDLLERGEGDEVFRAGRNYVMSAGMTDQNYFDFVRSRNTSVTGRGFINHLEGAIGVFGALVALNMDVIVVGNANDPREGTYRMTGQVQGIDIDATFEIYLRQDADSTVLSALMTGAWLQKNAAGAVPWIAWDPKGMSADGGYVGLQLEIPIEQPTLTERGERPGVPLLVAGTWAVGGFQVTVSDEAVFGARELGVLAVEKQ
jgi:hypothetical protein